MNFLNGQLNIEHFFYFDVIKEDFLILILKVLSNGLRAHDPCNVIF